MRKMQPENGYKSFAVVIFLKRMKFFDVPMKKLAD